MITFTLIEAAKFLKLHPEEVRCRAKAGRIPGAKVGKSWVFLDIDLAAYIRSLYAEPRQALRVALERKEVICHSTNAEARGGLISPHQAASVLDALLARKTAPKRKNSTIS